ncbi:MAG: hypothetical protein WA985_12450, partial [Erythrobacter sp.]
MADEKPKSGEKSGAASGMNVDTALVRELAELLSETGLSEIEVEDNDRKIRVARDMSLGQGGGISPAQIAAFGSLMGGGHGGQQSAPAPAPSAPQTPAPPPAGGP